MGSVVSAVFVYSRPHAQYQKQVLKPRPCLAWAGQDSPVPLPRDCQLPSTQHRGRSCERKTGMACLPALWAASMHIVEEEVHYQTGCWHLAYKQGDWDSKVSPPSQV